MTMKLRLKRGLGWPEFGQLAAWGLPQYFVYPKSPGTAALRPPPSCPRVIKGGRLATYDAAGLIGAFDDKTLNEPPPHGS